MALRNIREMGEDCLRCVCKEVTEINPRIEELVEDLIDTMYEADGVGLAAPQVGVRKRLVVIDCGDDPIVLINPVIISRKGHTKYWEACLSCLDNMGLVSRPYEMVVSYYDINGVKMFNIMCYNHFYQPNPPRNNN